MVAALVLTGGIGLIFFIRYLGIVWELHFLEDQMEEIRCGSQIELGTQGRQHQMLALCRKWNELQRQWQQEQRRYDQAERQLKQNITSLAHDIRTPLTGAAGYVQMAQECKEAEQQAHYLEIAQRRLKELEDMLEELFYYTKLTSESFEPVLEEIQLFPLLSECLIGWYHQFEERGIAPEVDWEAEGVRAWADEECVRRVFHNLIQNALAHGTGGLIIRQNCRKEEKELLCLIFENRLAEGSKPDPEQIFDRFYKADFARRKGSSGLGLFIVKELTEKMGGSVSAEIKGEWLRLEIHLRLAAQRQSEETERQEIE